MADPVKPAQMGWLDRIVNVNWGARDILVVEAQYSDVLFNTNDFRTIATAVGTGFMLSAVQVLLGSNILDPTGSFGTSQFFRLGTHVFTEFEPTVSGTLVFDITMLKAAIGPAFKITLNFNAPGMAGADQIDGNVFATFHTKVQSIKYVPSQLGPAITYAKGGGPGASAVDTARGLFSPPNDHFSVAVAANLTTRAAPVLTFTPP